MSPQQIGGLGALRQIGGMSTPAQASGADTLTGGPPAVTVALYPSSMLFPSARLFPGGTVVATTPGVVS